MAGDMSLFLTCIILIFAGLLLVTGLVDLVNWIKDRQKSPPFRWQPVRRKAVEGGRKSEWDEVVEMLERRKAS